MFKMSFFKKFNPFTRRKKEEPEKLESKIIAGENKRIISKRKGVRWQPESTSKFKNKGLPWFQKIGLTKKPGLTSQFVLREFGTFSKLYPFRANGRALVK